MPNIIFATDVEVTQSRFPLPLSIQCGLALSLFVLAVLLPPLHLFSGPQPYLPLHITLEFLSIAAALMIFTIGWFSFGHERSARFQILACAFLAVALLDFVHTLSYAGMPYLVTPNSLEKAINLWLSARIISAMALMATALLPLQTTLSRWVRGWALAATLTMTGVIIAMGLFFPDTAPRTFIPGQGLTLFKVEEALHVSLAEVKCHDAQMIDLNRMNDLLLSCETHEEAYAIIAREDGRLFAGCIGGLVIAHQAAAPELRVVATWGDANTLPTTFSTARLLGVAARGTP